MRHIITIALIVAVLLAILFYAYRTYVRQPIAILSTATLQAQLIPSRAGDMRVGGMILLASALKTLRNETYKNRSLLLDAGNSMFQDNGHLEFSQKMPELLGKMQFDAITLGFRDFSVAEKLDWSALPPVLGCNVVVENPSSKFNFIPSKLFVIRGARIAVIGAVDPGTLEYQDDTIIPGVHILNVARTREQIQREADHWSQEKVDAIILLSSALDPKVNDYFAENIRHLNVIVGRNESDHGSIGKKGSTTIVTAASGGKTIGVVHATRVNGNLSLEARSEIDVNSEQFRPDGEFLNYARRYWIDYALKSEDHVIGSVKDMDGIRGIPLQLEHPLLLGYPYWSYFESPMLRLVAQAMREEYPLWDKNHSSTKVDIAFVNGGTLEDGLSSGVVTLTMLRRALPYNNKVAEIILTRKQIVEMLNSKAMKGRGILGVAGLEYIWDYNTGQVDERSLRYKPLEGKPVPLAERKYVVVVSDFVLHGGDGYMRGSSFESARSHYKRDSGPEMVELLRKYIYRKSPISASDTPQARFLR